MGALVGQAGPYRFYAVASGLVGAMVGALALGCLAGRWLDSHLGTRPWFTLGGTLVGLAAAVATLVRILPMGGGRA